MVKKTNLIFLLGIIIISFTSATELGVFKQNECISLYQLCDTCTYVNITSVKIPNSTIININEIMDKNGVDYTYSFCDTSLTGEYQYSVCGDKGTFVCEEINFEVTATGKELSSAKATSYGILSVISILIFLGLLWIGIALPSKNKSDEMTGYILAVSNIKYLKYTLLALSYVTLVWIMYFFWMITYAYLDFEFLSNIFRFMFTFLAISSLPLFILFAFLTITNLIRDSNIKEALMRGLRVNG